MLGILLEVAKAPRSLSKSWHVRFDPAFQRAKDAAIILCCYILLYCRECIILWG